MTSRNIVGEAADNTLEDLDAAAARYAECRDTATSAERDSLRETLIRYCLPFAGRLARRYRGRGEYLEDLEQVARLGLVKAIDRYDPERGSFTAYAVITISGELKRHFRDRTWGVHVPRRVQDLSLEVGHASTVLTSTLARTPSIAELAAHLRVTEAAVLEAVESAAGYSPASLNAPVTGDGLAEFGDLLGDVDDDLESITDKLTVTDLLMRLPARERRMLAMRFYGNRTQAEIAAELGISQMHVSRLLSRALAWLREAMLSDTTPRWEGAESRTGQHHGMQVLVDAEDAAAVVRVRGEVDRDTVERLRIGLRHAIGSGSGAVVVDFSGVPLVDAAGVAVLVEAVRAAGEARVDLCVSGAQPYVARVLAVSGLEAVLRRC
ncbi:putative RNA polymerase sigma factor with STAS domain [Actinoplanes missouriensis 431]|uniref:Anti-sigma factor antagonist n=1 Tax=Actinoplanes missouriensis (strain ATCC 14538 / DSM 43046 / CBS 188.64 / JCM 3121 / NBRC 102363 / NCIMB 12654 / NRRL B-3342 / UNCC 431) TaxID=512565 RepID=I0HCA7_ACTM4|nr:SigB/SigF/SigG family RNA polymerase sigma factor [Actinoplanes missouriensis]BAL90644.1 putative RNA polymerase sigma factor with STAS domain [Actinoplanes missouriensis 431]